MAIKPIKNINELKLPTFKQIFKYYREINKDLIFGTLFVTGLELILTHNKGRMIDEFIEGVFDFFGESQIKSFKEQFTESFEDLEELKNKHQMKILTSMIYDNSFLDLILRLSEITEAPINKYSKNEHLNQILFICEKIRINVMITSEKLQKIKNVRKSGVISLHILSQFDQFSILYPYEYQDLYLDSQDDRAGAQEDIRKISYNMLTENKHIRSVSNNLGSFNPLEPDLNNKSESQIKNREKFLRAKREQKRQEEYAKNLEKGQFAEQNRIKTEEIQPKINRKELEENNTLNQCKTSEENRILRQDLNRKTAEEQLREDLFNELKGIRIKEEKLAVENTKKPENKSLGEELIEEIRFKNDKRLAEEKRLLAEMKLEAIKNLINKKDLKNAEEAASDQTTTEENKVTNYSPIINNEITSVIITKKQDITESNFPIKSSLDNSLSVHKNPEKSLPIQLKKYSQNLTENWVDMERKKIESKKNEIENILAKTRSFKVINNKLPKITEMFPHSERLHNFQSAKSQRKFASFNGFSLPEQNTNTHVRSKGSVLEFGYFDEIYATAKSSRIDLTTRTLEDIRILSSSVLQFQSLSSDKFVDIDTLEQTEENQDLDTAEKLEKTPEKLEKKIGVLTKNPFEKTETQSEMLENFESPEIENNEGEIEPPLIIITPPESLEELEGDKTHSEIEGLCDGTSTCGGMYCLKCTKDLKKGNFLLKCLDCCSGFKGQEASFPSTKTGSNNTTCMNCSAKMAKGEEVLCICCFLRLKIKKCAVGACAGCSKAEKIVWVDASQGPECDLIQCMFCDELKNKFYVFKICLNCNELICLPCLRKNPYVVETICSTCHERRTFNLVNF